MTGYLGTETEFINHESRTWGIEYIEELLDKGYEPKLTTDGWRWILPVKVEKRLALLEY